HRGASAPQRGGELGQRDQQVAEQGGIDDPLGLAARAHPLANAPARIRFAVAARAETKEAALRRLPDVFAKEAGRQKPMPPIPPMPPPGGIAGAASSFGSSATIASVVISRPETEPASCSAVRTTLAGSMMPLATMSTYSSFWAS